MELLIIWLVLCAFIGKVAMDRGRDGIAWFFVAFFISPLLAGIIVLVAPRKGAVQVHAAPMDIPVTWTEWKP